MYAGVGSAAACDFYIRPGQFRKSLFYSALNSYPIRLRLPAVDVYKRQVLDCS